jgi:hypothetical protein
MSKSEARVIPDQWKFETPVARLYKYVSTKETPKRGAVKTPHGQGTLLMAHSYPKGCMVELTAERRTAKDGTRVYMPCRYYDHTEIQEV